ncbi:MAG: hypothetical protein ACR2HP_06665 [Ilumatobacteraceae bacterium]
MCLLLVGLRGVVVVGVADWPQWVRIWCAAADAGRRVRAAAPWRMITAAARWS